MTTPIIHQNNDWLILNKPTQYASDAPSFISIVQMYTKGVPRAINHLDKNVSGLLLLPTGDNNHKVLSSDISKVYIFLSKDRPRRKGVFRELSESNGIFCYEYKGNEDSSQLLKKISKAGIKLIGNTAQYDRLALHLSAIELGGTWHRSPQPDSFTFLLEKREKIVLDTALACERRAFFPALTSNCYRLIHRGELDIAASIDLYNKNLLISGFSDKDNSETLYSKLSPALNYLQEKVGWQGGLLRKHALNPHQKKLAHDVYSFGEEVEETTIVHEHGLDYAVNINSSQHVGLFLDMRDMRKKVMEEASGKRVANLFSFTCSFSLAAVAQGAEVVFSVDLAGSTLNRGKENFRINDLESSGRGKFVKEDVMKWLARQEKRHNQDPENYTSFDLVICDPPVFASAGKGRGFHVEKQWPILAQQIRTILSDDGIALFANNHRGGDSAFYLAELKKHFRTVEQLSPALDFPKISNSPEHVRIYWCKA